VVVCPGGQAELVYAYTSHSAVPSIAPMLASTASGAGATTAIGKAAAARVGSGCGGTAGVNPSAADGAAPGRLGERGVAAAGEPLSEGKESCSAPEATTASRRRASRHASSQRLARQGKGHMGVLFAHCRPLSASEAAVAAERWESRRGSGSDSKVGAPCPAADPGTARLLPALDPGREASTGRVAAWLLSGDVGSLRTGSAASGSPGPAVAPGGPGSDGWRPSVRALAGGVSGPSGACSTVTGSPSPCPAQDEDPKASTLQATMAAGCDSRAALESAIAPVQDLGQRDAAVFAGQRCVAGGLGVIGGSDSDAAGAGSSSSCGNGVRPAVGEMVIYAGHKGFVRMAIEQQAALVPVLAIGEVLQLRNLLHMPRLQKWSYRKLGFPVPWFMGA
jgi:hypothetical protein